MAIRARGELVDITDSVILKVLFRDQNGAPTDLDSYPQITITQPNGSVSLGPTSAGVSNYGPGLYGFQYSIGFAGPYGIYVDSWLGMLNGFPIDASFNFVVTHSDQPAINSDGYIHLGADPGFQYSQLDLLNINKLMKTLRARLNNSGKAKSVDNYGNTIYIDCSVFSVDMMATFIADSLTAFNEVPYFTYFTFHDTMIINQFHNILVEGATLMALASQALIERGREFTIADNGINFTPPTVSELLNTQYGTLLTNYYDKLKYIKNSMRSSPIGQGTFSPLMSGLNPQVRRLRFLKERQII